MIRRLFSRDESENTDAELRRLEEKRRSVQKAVDQWLSLLREMEQQGQSNHAEYERYYRAHADSRKQLKQIELEIFNVRSRRPS